MATARYGKGLTGLIKRGWAEIPEVLGSSVLALIGIGCGSLAVYHANKYQDSKKKYRFNYTIYRDDDPKVAEVRKWGPVN